MELSYKTNGIYGAYLRMKKGKREEDYLKKGGCNDLSHTSHELLNSNML
jgi:hypothetical protein